MLLNGPALSRGVNKMPLRVTSSLNYSVVLFVRTVLDSSRFNTACLGMRINFDWRDWNSFGENIFLQIVI